MKWFIIFGSIYLFIPLAFGLACITYKSYTESLYGKAKSLADIVAKECLDANSYDHAMLVLVAIWPLLLVIGIGYSLYLISLNCLEWPGKALGKHVKKKQLQAEARLKERDKKFYIEKTNKPLDQYLNGD